MKSYSDKLKDPRWQRKRLEILNRDNFTCTRCGNDKETLHVHHIKYNTDPWDVEDKFLLTLCFPCHEAIEFAKTEYKMLLEHIQATMNLDSFVELKEVIRSVAIMKLNPFEVMMISKLVDRFGSEDYTELQNRFDKDDEDLEREINGD